MILNPVSRRVGHEACMGKMRNNVSVGRSGWKRYKDTWEDIIKNKSYRNRLGG